MSSFFLHILRDPRFITIEEQYPLLPIERAIAVAKEMNVTYPTYPYSSRVEVVMTSDFKCKTVYGSDVVYSIKDSRVFHDKVRWSQRRQDNFENKLKLEKAFWKSQGVKYHLISSGSLKTDYSRNLHLMAQYIHIDLYLKVCIDTWLSVFKRNLSKFQNKSLADFVGCLSDEVGLGYFDSVAILFYSLWHRLIYADLNQTLNFEKSVLDFNFRALNAS